MNPFDLSVKRFDEFAREYAERFKNIDAYLPCIEKFCDLIIPAKPRILELACGPGNITRYLKKRFPDSDYIAIDLAPGMIDIARQSINGVDFRLMDVRTISLFDSKFDAIMCSFCLPFLSRTDSLKLISDCSARLNPDGVIYISTMEGDESEAGFETTSFSGFSEVYFNYHLQKDIENALSENAFLINETRRQVYYESDGSTMTDMIFLGIKK
jgi:trans-aconitate methyltransferase